VNTVQRDIKLIRKLLKENNLGLKERQGREREAVSRAILDAARELFVTVGYQEVSIRKIADRIEYSPAAIYGYFESKDDIFFALAEEGFRLLASFGGEPPVSSDPLDEIRWMFWQYYEFSKVHPEYFALMFLDRSVPRISSNWERFEFVGDLKNQMAVRIQRAIDAGAFPRGMSPIAVFRVLLTATHGAAALRLCERLAARENADALARSTLEAALQGLRAGAGLDPQLSSWCIASDERSDRHDS
jgi:AcrR family transcriptional regulator